MANLSNINNKFLFTDGDFLKIGNLAPINNISGTESGISVTNSNVASITLDNTAASGKTFVIYSDDGGKLNFYDVDASSGRLVIDTSGNVGIGVTPSVKLQVWDTGGGNVASFSNGANADLDINLTNGVTTLTPTTGILAFGTSSVEKMRIDSNGNFGFRVIAENSSGTWRNFQIGGGANLVTRGSNANDLLLGTGFYFNTANQELYKNTEAVSRMFFNNDVMTFQNAASGTADTAITWNERMRITSDGMVGIGMTPNTAGSSTYMLQMYNPGSQCFLSIGNGTSGNGPLNGLVIGNDTNVAYIVNREATPLYFATSDANRMAILAGGNVGIGTTGPQALLDVSKNNTTIYDPTDDLGQRAGTATIHIANQTATTNTFGQLMYDSRSSGQGIARIVFLNGGSATVGIAFVTEHSEVKSEKMRIQSNGNVGIGTDNPQSKLHVKSSESGASAPWTNADNLVIEDSGNAGLAFQTPNTGAATIAFQDPESVQAGFIQHADNALRFATNGNNERMRITSTGAISVGSSGTAYGTAGQVLTSNGNASPSWQAAGGGSAWPQEKFAEYTINSTTSNILVATMNSTTWHGNYLSGCLKFTMSTSDYVQVTYVPVSTFLSGSSEWFFKGTEMTSKNNGSNPAQLVFTFAGDQGTYGSTCTLKINRNQNVSNYIKVNVLVQAISNPNMFILN
jgi:hypothetical protein